MKYPKDLSNFGPIAEIYTKIFRFAQNDPYFAARPFKFLKNTQKSARMNFIYRYIDRGNKRRILLVNKNRKKMIFMHGKKRLLAFALAAIMAVSMGGTALASNIVPRWDNARVCASTLSFSGTTAICDVSIQGMSGTTKIDPKITLQKENSSGGFSAGTSWEPSAVSGSSFTWSGTRRSCTSGTDYRLKVEADVPRNGTTETITVYSDPVTCP